MLPISVCIITKNEEKYLETCLQKLKRYDFEIIVTDTGSTDHTVAIAGEYADQVHHFTWINDFSAARNFCISKASKAVCTRLFSSCTILSIRNCSSLSFSNNLESTTF